MTSEERKVRIERIKAEAESRRRKGKLESILMLAGCFRLIGTSGGVPMATALEKAVHDSFLLSSEPFAAFDTCNTRSGERLAGWFASCVGELPTDLGRCLLGMTQWVDAGLTEVEVSGDGEWLVCLYKFTEGEAIEFGPVVANMDQSQMVLFSEEEHSIEAFRWQVRC